MGTDGRPHVPVLLKEVVEWLTPALGTGGPLVDCTLGFGGHAQAFLEAFPSLVVIGIDKDDEALAWTRRELARFGGRLVAVKRDLGQIAEVVQEQGYEAVEAVLYDLGTSSVQLDRLDRGFRYSSGSPLDMRMDREGDLRAEDVVNTYDERSLARILSRYGEERFAARIARAVVRRRQERPFTDAGDLAEVVKEAIPAATRRTGPHPARRTFQALRIEVNHELESLATSVEAAIDLLGPGGRIAAISYHSLEDRIVKRALAGRAKGCICPRDLPVCACGRQAEVRVLTSKPIRPTPDEIAGNPRSDSAKMRVAIKLEVAA